MAGSNQTVIMSLTGYYVSLDGWLFVIFELLLCLFVYFREWRQKKVFTFLSLVFQSSASLTDLTDTQALIKLYAKRKSIAVVCCSARLATTHTHTHVYI